MSAYGRVAVHASATVMHSVPAELRVPIGRDTWGTEFLPSEVVEVLALVTEWPTGRPLDEPTWRYEVQLSGPRVTRRGKESQQLELATFGLHELPVGLIALLVGRETLHGRIRYASTTDLPDDDHTPAGVGSVAAAVAAPEAEQE